MTEETPQILNKPNLAVVVPFTGPTKAELPVGDILEAAGKANLQNVICLGLNQDDSLFIATSDGYLPDILWLLELCKKEILEASLNSDDD
jgi:hypothetical protein